MQKVKKTIFLPLTLYASCDNSKKSLVFLLLMCYTHANQEISLYLHKATRKMHTLIARRDNFALSNAWKTLLSEQIILPN